MSRGEASQSSYHRHERHLQQYAHGQAGECHAQSWLRTGSVGAWRFQRMYSVLDPLLEAFPKARWVTIGDGRYGGDAHYIIEKGVEALATDISDVLLKEAHEKGYIHAYRKENAEELSFANGEFDFCFCKESYHHFPRPMIALYEMLRVAKKGVLLLEPNDPYIGTGVLEVIFRDLKDRAKALLGREVQRHAFEPVGNYCYCISEREVEKVVLGLNLNAVAFRGVNDYYVEGVEYEEAVPGSRLFSEVQKKIAIRDMLCRLGLQKPALLAVAIFKERIAENLTMRLAAAGYKVVRLPENPFLTKANED